MTTNDFNIMILLALIVGLLVIALAAAIGKIIRQKEQLEIEMMRQGAMVDAMREVRKQGRDVLKKEMAERNHREHMLEEKLRVQKEHYEQKMKEMGYRLAVAEKAANQNWPKSNQPD